MGAGALQVSTEQNPWYMVDGVWLIFFSPLFSFFPFLPLGDPERPVRQWF